jgi:hypothetical protein
MSVLLISGGWTSGSAPRIDGAFSAGYADQDGLQSVLGQPFVAPVDAVPSGLYLGWIHFASNRCVADFVEPFGTLNFFDVARFIQLFAAQSSDADLASPFGVLDFFDIAQFLSEYQSGC